MPVDRQERVRALLREAEHHVEHALAEAGPRVARARVETYRWACERFACADSLGMAARAEQLTGQVCVARGDLSGATAAYRTAVWMRTLLHEPDREETVRALALTRVELSAVLFEQGELDAARAQLAEVGEEGGTRLRALRERLAGS